MDSDGQREEFNLIKEDIEGLFEKEEFYALMSVEMRKHHAFK